MKMKSLEKKILLISLLLLSLSILVSAVSRKKIITPSPSPTAKIKDYPYIDGLTGINSYTKTFSSNSCYNPPTIHLGASETEEKLSSSMSRKELFDSLKMSVKVNVDVGMGKGSASSNMEKTFVENSNTSSHYYYVKFTRNRFFSYSPTLNSILNAQGLKTYNMTVQKKIEDFYKYCGDSVVTSVKEGGFIAIQVNIEFKNEKNKNLFAGKIEVGIGDLGSIGSTLKTSSDLKKLGGTIIFKGVQVGGDAGKFYELFPQNTSDKCSSSVATKGNSHEGCTEFLKSISNYIRTDFSKQFNAKDNDENIYKTFNYKQRVNDVFTLPTFDKTNAKSNELINKLNVFTKTNDYYYSKLKEFKKNYYLTNHLEKKLDDKIKAYKKTLLENNNNLKINSFGDFKFSNCLEDSDNCNETNFNTAFKSLKDIFKDIDAMMLPMKFVVDYDLQLSSCGVFPLTGADISVRVYPLGGNTFYLRHLKNNFVDFRSDILQNYSMPNSKAYALDKFTFHVYDLYPTSEAVVTPTTKDNNSFKVKVTCATGITYSTGVRQFTPNYFEPYANTDY